MNIRSARRFRLLLLLMLSALVGFGCAAWRAKSTLPVDHSTVVEQLVIYSDFELPRQHRLFDELKALRGHISSTLGVGTSDEPIHVYLFQNEDRYGYFIEQYYAELPDRRAFFLKTDTSLAVYAQWGDRIGEDLRHEVTHAYLHSVIPDLPLWLDEGLAESFEVSHDATAVHPEHWKLLAKAVREEGWQPDLTRLESLDDIAQMQRMEYAESWAWVHCLLNSSPSRKVMVTEYLHALQQGESAVPFSVRLAEEGEGGDELLLAHLRKISLQ